MNNPFDVQVGGDHYKNMRIQPVEFITANNIGFLEGCVIKRMCRWQNKNGLEDLRKAIHEIELLMEFEKAKHSECETRNHVHTSNPPHPPYGTILREDEQPIFFGDS